MEICKAGHDHAGPVIAAERIFKKWQRCLHSWKLQLFAHYTPIPPNICLATELYACKHKHVLKCGQQMYYKLAEYISIFMPVYKQSQRLFGNGNET